MYWTDDWEAQRNNVLQASKQSNRMFEFDTIVKARLFWSKLDLRNLHNVLAKVELIT
jgi:hypothetical protein